MWTVYEACRVTYMKQFNNAKTKKNVYKAAMWVSVGMFLTQQNVWLVTEWSSSEWSHYRHAHNMCKRRIWMLYFQQTNVEKILIYIFVTLGLFILTGKNTDFRNNSLIFILKLVTPEITLKYIWCLRNKLLKKSCLWEICVI